MNLPNRYRRVINTRRTRTYRRFILWLSGIRFYGGRVSLYDVVDTMLHQLKLDSLTKRASYMAFNFTVALFPTIIFLFTLIPYIPVPGLNQDILQFLGDIMPREMYAATRETIEDIVNIPHGGLLSFGFATALVLSSNGIMALLDAFDKKHSIFRRRSYLRKRAIATVLTVGLAVALLVSVVALLFGTYIVDALVYYEIVPERLTGFLLGLLKYGSVVGLFLFGTCAVYYYVPAVHSRWPFLSVGAVVATVLILLVSLLFALYVRIFDSYNHFYGSIGTLVGFMVWLDFVCMTLILGFEVNISMDEVTGRGERKRAVSAALKAARAH
ncbi:YihY/virulence factor BrkB family protein [Hymenobacter busanensis]|uniref:YihY/virulence factor BrkB family protein n=1 Tax=Hymenobacter busanensis TaxID=2607656 RepID=A0A7L4ZV34_9BACT|nr:YihY/virulence factor BrkB family protein [Hymenobacter busanensis]KAA9332369.1 YihY/virulence factor BrkB family protein [Hymenobacter busanensis]QHJ07294.1 YihY family inner membrane protein [Hymenobacter busanensis]